MSDTLVILAAGKGTRMGRVGDQLHKALVPLCNKAIISHIIEEHEADRIVICLGYRGDQIRSYMALAHPKLDVTFVEVPGWDQPGAGPGASLLAARDAVGDNDMIFTSCDTLIKYDAWPAGYSAVALAPVPAGTNGERWCRMGIDEYAMVDHIADKTATDYRGRLEAYTGCARILKEHLHDFWQGIEYSGATAEGEIQVTAGLKAVATHYGLSGDGFVGWTDIGDEDAYRRAVAEMSGYDWTKANEATFILPEEGRVVKFWGDDRIALERAARAWALNGNVPRLVGADGSMLAYEYVDGETCYVSAEWDDNLVDRIFAWATDKIWKDAYVREDEAVAAADSFYCAKSYDRVARLPEHLRWKATDMLNRIDWEWLTYWVQPVIWHGDFNFGNIIRRDDGSFVGIDWRQDFAGHIYWGDRRYDLAKLLGGCIVHWDDARHGDFRPWLRGAHHAKRLHQLIADDDERKQVITITGLHFLNSAPLHAAPLDEVLVSRGIKLLEEVTQ